MIFSEYAPYDYTLESSRSPHGPVSAFATLKTLGVEGFIKILAGHTDAYLYLKNNFNKQNNTVVCNLEEESNLLFLAFKPEKYHSLVITEQTPQKVADKIKEFNTGFYSFLLEKAKSEKIDFIRECIAGRVFNRLSIKRPELSIPGFNDIFTRELGKCGLSLAISKLED